MRRAGGRPAPDRRGLRERRVGGVQPDGLAGPADHHRRLAGRAGLPEPAGLDRQGGRRHHHALVRRDAAVQGARVQGPDALRRDRGRQPAGLADHARRARAVLRPGRDSIGSTHRHGRPPLPANNNYKVFANGAERIGYTATTPPVRTARTPSRTTAGPAIDPGRLQLPGRQEQVEVEHRWSGRSRARWRPATATCGRTATPCRSPTTPAAAPTRCCTSTRRATCSGRRAKVVCVAGNSIETPRLLLMRASVAAPGRSGELLGPGGPQLHAAHHRVGLRAVRQAGAHVPRRDDGRDHRRRVAARHRRAASPAATTWRRSSLGPAFLAAFIDPGAWGPDVHRDHGRLREHRRACGSSARTCRRRPTGSR